MNTRQKVLKEALNCVNGEREKQYGNPEDNFKRIADLWSVYLTSLFEDEKIVIDIDPIDVAKMMILFKIARSNGDKDKLDNYVDIIGYGACAAEIFENQDRDDILEKRFGAPMEKVNAFEELLDNKDPYSYAHDKLANYVSIKAKEEHISLDIDNLKNVNRKFPRELSDYLHDAVKDCVENGKQILDCYKEIDELFNKWIKKKPDNKNEDKTKHLTPLKKNIEVHLADYILGESINANVEMTDVVAYLADHGYKIGYVANKIINNEIHMDDFASLVSDAISALKKDDKK